MWEEVLHAFTEIRAKKNMIVVLVGHCMIKRVESPDTESYDKYMLNVRDIIGDRIIQWADNVFFMNYKVRVRDEDGVKKGVTNKKRYLYTKDTPMYKAKDSYGMPDEIEVPEDFCKTWNIIGSHLTNFYKKSKKSNEVINNNENNENGGKNE